MSTFGRVIGHVRGEAPGPTLIITTLIHGNEAAGAIAAQRVLAGLERAHLHGEVLVLAGNLAANALGKRHQVKDLNRQWTESKVGALRARDPAQDDAEDREQRALLEQLDRAIASARGPVYSIDLHTTSAAGYPFGIYDSAREEPFAMAFPLPTIRGLAVALAGVLTSYLVGRGVIAIAIEGGQHDDGATIDHLAASCTVALAASGVLDEAHVPGLAEARTHLDVARGQIPRALKVVARYSIVPSDAFVMAPGFANIAHVRRGQLLAKDARGTIRAPANGYVILPLYQGQGDDGFFFGRAIG